jgi:hypothetical protein
LPDNNYRIIILDLDKFVKIDGSELKECSDTEATSVRFYPSIETINYLWNEKKHIELVTAVFEVLKKNTFDQFSEARNRALQLWNDNQEEILRGLCNADIKSKYTNKYSFSNHFYNPNTKGNYWFANPPLNSPLLSALKFLFYSEDTALTRTIHHLKNALYSQKVPYNVGLALHYLTDLSQPMHASDWPNFATDYRHCTFEKIADLSKIIDLGEYTAEVDFIQKLVVEAQKAEGLDNQITSIVHGLAVQSQQIFNEMIKPKLENEWKWGKDITPETADPILSKTFSLGITYAVALLLLWGNNPQSNVQNK